MGFFERLANQLPSLRNQIQLTGLIILVAGFIIVRTTQPDAVLGQLATGSIGILVIIFGTATPVLRILPSGQRAWALIAMLITLLILIIALAIISANLMTKAARANQLQTIIQSNIDKGFCRDAEDDAVELIRLDPTNGHSYNLSGAAKYCLNQWEEAVAEWEKARELEPHNQRVLFNLGAALIRWECGTCFVKAQEIYEELASHSNDDMAVIFNLALTQALNADYNNSVRNAERVLSGGKAYASFLRGILEFLTTYTEHQSSDRELTKRVVDIFKEAERTEAEYICMLFDGRSMSNSYKILIDRAKTYRAYEGLITEMLARSWGNTC